MGVTLPLYGKLKVQKIPRETLSDDIFLQFLCPNLRERMLQVIYIDASPLHIMHYLYKCCIFCSVLLTNILSMQLEYNKA